jgi:hypothetical protein
VHVCPRLSGGQGDSVGTSDSIETLRFAPVRFSNLDQSTVLLVLCGVREHEWQCLSGIGLIVCEGSLRSDLCMAEELLLLLRLNGQIETRTIQDNVGTEDRNLKGATAIWVVASSVSTNTH